MTDQNGQEDKRQTPPASELPSLESDRIKGLLSRALNEPRKLKP